MGVLFHIQIENRQKYETICVERKFAALTIGTLQSLQSNEVNSSQIKLVNGLDTSNDK